MQGAPGGHQAHRGSAVTMMLSQARYGASSNARQMRYRSPWIQALAAAEPAGRYRLFTCWHTCGDNIVFPLGTAVLHGAKVLYLPHVGHVALAGHPEVLAHTLALLRH
mgnify:CR=1 FL=1